MHARAVPRSPASGRATRGSVAVAVGFMLVCCALVAATTLIAKILGQGLNGPPMHPLQVSAARFGFGLVALLPFALWLQPSFRGAAWPVHVGRSLCGWAYASLLFAAAALMPLADATAISFLSPLFTLLLAIPLLGERVGPWRFGAAALAFTGVLVLIRPGTDAFQPAALLALAGALFGGLEAVLIKRLTRGEPPIRILVINNTIGATLALAAAAPAWSPPTAVQWTEMAALGATMVLAQACFLQALKRGDASFVVPFFYTTLLFAAVYDLAVFGVVPVVWSGLGAALIVTGALVLAWREGRRH